MNAWTFLDRHICEVGFVVMFVTFFGGATLAEWFRSRRPR